MSWLFLLIVLIIVLMILFAIGWNTLAWIILIAVFILIVIPFCIVVIRSTSAEMKNKYLQKEIEKKKIAQRKLLLEGLKYLNLTKTKMDSLFGEYDSTVIVNSRQALDSYNTDIFFKQNKNQIKEIKEMIESKEKIINTINIFLKKPISENPFFYDTEYKYLKDYFNEIIKSKAVFKIKVIYITYAGNNLGSRILQINLDELKIYENNPSLLLTKEEIKELNRVKKEKEQEMKKALNDKKIKYCSIIDEIVKTAKNLDAILIFKTGKRSICKSIDTLLDNIKIKIFNITTVDSSDWDSVHKLINNEKENIRVITEKNEKIINYYNSEDFIKIKRTSEKLMQSQKDFNAYIKEKIDFIEKTFGLEVKRDETKHNDTYQYIRPYEKTISPLTKEVSANVFSNAENNPIQYLIKYFYPNKSLYEDQIINLKNLLNELETLKDAKQIIENHKLLFKQNLNDVPNYILKDDEDGFYSRLGFVNIDEEIFKIKYTFKYTSDGGMAQRSFSVPITEDSIYELIETLQNKSSLTMLAKEQRALLTPRLRQFILKRDNYTCCNCGNSIYKEPNLLLEVDHKIPIAKGGLTVDENLQTLCWKCNRSKGSKLEYEL